MKNRNARWLSARSISALALSLSISASAWSVPTTVLQDFEGSGAGVAVSVDSSNSSAGGAANSFVNIATETASKRLAITDADGGFNGAALTIPGAITGPGHYLFTADIKVDNAGGAIGSYGIGAKLGAPSTSDVSDANAGYIMNLTGSGDAALGYQTIGAALEAPISGTYPADVTLYFGTDVSSNNFTAPVTDGDFNNTHRSNGSAWPAASSNAVYVDNIKRVGPGGFGEDRHMWISVGDAFTNLASLESQLVQAKANNFNCIDILGRFRADAYYVPNRTDATYANPEPFGTRVGTLPASATNDPLQYAIDRGHELGLKVYVAFSTFLVSPNSTYPSTLPADSIMWYYNGGAPRPMLTTDPGAEGLWADLGQASVRNYTKNILMDLVTNYDIDGVMFDRIRYPGADYSYNPVTLAEMGVIGTPTPTSTSFRELRRKAVTDFLQECYEAVTTKKPWVVVGATPIAYGNTLVDTYNSVFQSWPHWTARRTANRVVDFGVLDVMHPQLYRLSSTPAPFTAPGANTLLLNKTIFGDLSVNNKDFGIPRGNMLMAPLFFHPAAGDTPQSNANAQNIVDSRGLFSQGFGLFNATPSLADMTRIRAAGASTAGVDILAASAPTADHILKTGYETLAPNAVTGFTASPQTRGSVVFNWTAPAPAADGDPANGYYIYKSTSSPVKETYANQVNKLPIAGTQTFFHAPVGNAGNYYYKIVPIDDYNNRGASSQVGPFTVAGVPAVPADVIVDNPAATKIGAWTLATSATDKFGINYNSRGVGTGANKVVFSAQLPASGSWNVSEWHPAGTNRPPNARHFVQSNAGTNTVTVDQRINGGKWNQISTQNFTAGTTYTVTIDDVFTVGTVMADAIRFSFVATPAPVPAAPTNLAANVISANQINLTWTDNATNESGYELERTIAGGSSLVITQIAADATSYSDTTLAPDTEYVYVLRAFTNSTQSADSNMVAARTLPEIPADIIVDNPAATFVGAWSTSTATGKFGVDYRFVSKGTGLRTATFPFTPARSAVYDIYEWHLAGTNRALDAPHAITHRGGVSTIIVNQQLNSAKWNKIGTFQFDGGVAYNIKLSDNFLVGTVLMADAMKIVYAGEPPTTPAAPTGLQATVISDSEISISWMDNAVNETGYEVLRTKAGDAPQTVASLGVDAVSFADTGLVALTNYTYEVRAVNAAGNSAYSAPVTATTLSSTPPDVIVDNLQATLVGAWSIQNTAADRFGINYVFRGKSATGTGKAIFPFKARDTGVYDIFEWHPVGTNRPTDARHTVTHRDGSSTVLVNQRLLGGQWNKIGTYAFNGPTTYTVTIDDQFVDGLVIMADAVKIVWVGELPPAPVAPVLLSAAPVGGSQVNLTWENGADETGYQVVRNGVVVANLPADATAYSDTGLLECTVYNYQIRASNLGGVSADSNTLSAKLDATAPVLSAPADITVGADAGSCTATNVALGSASASDACSTFNVTNDAPATFGLGVTTVTYTATDARGNVSTAVQTVTVEDNEAPVLGSLEAVSVNADADSCSAASVVLVAPTTADNCSEVVLTNDAPASFPLGTTLVTWTGTDAAGNTSQVTVNVTVVDAQAPTLEAAADATVSAEAGICGAASAALVSAVANDLCGTVQVTNDAPAVFPVGTTTVTYTATDEAGNTAQDKQIVTVTDNENPTLTAPAAVSANADAGSCSATNVALGDAIAADNCGEVTVTNDAPATFAVGTTVVTWTATDSAGNSVTATQDVTVVDDELPTITAPASITIATETDLCDAAATLGTPDTADNCGVASVTNDAPARFSKGTTTVTYTVTDIHGNVATAEQIVTVEDRQKPVIDCNDNITVGASLNLLVQVPFEVTATDNCGTVEVVTDAPVGGFPVGTTVVTVTATDESGNVSTCQFTVTRAALSFTGFSAPISGNVEDGNGGTAQSPKSLSANQTVHFRMTLSLDGQPVVVGTHKLTAQKYANGTLGAAFAVNDSNGSNAFNLTSASGQWEVKSKLKDVFSKDSTYLFTATMSDGSTRTLWVTMK